jgi:hypothetical protein
MIEDMKDEDILDKARMEGMNQGIWLAVQELAHDGRWTQAAEELISSCGLTEDECRKLQEESESFNDEMIKFIDNMFGRENMISEGSTISENDTICINIKYHKIGEVFNYKVGMSEMTLFKYNTGMEKIELEVIEIDDSSCDGCVFNNRGYYCMYSCCCNIDREDNTDVIYKEVKRS